MIRALLILRWWAANARVILAALGGMGVGSLLFVWSGLRKLARLRRAERDCDCDAD